MRFRDAPLAPAVAALLLLAPLRPDAAPKPPSQNIVDTPHNLSITGGGGLHDIRSTVEERICIFCHTPHHAAGVTPLWSREVSALTIYIPYTSPTMRANPNQPMGGSRLCLSCHDGTIALGTLAGGHNLDRTLPSMPWDPEPSRNPNLGTDLSDDHPISVAYPFGQTPELTNPDLWPPGVRLEEQTFLECSSCHDPHNNQYGNFLVLDTRVQRDALCTVCHEKTGWDDPDAAHRTGGTRYPTVAPQVAAAGCRNCHLPHSAPGVPLLLTSAQEENTCLAACHRGAPYADVWSAFTNAAYRHPVTDFQGVHRANPSTRVEDVPVPRARKHVECVDCHNPHRSGAAGSPMVSDSGSPAGSTPPAVSGALRGVRGIDRAAQSSVPEARYEYEICFKCHAGTSAPAFTSFGGRPTRQLEALDESQRFSLFNPSYHPVVENRLGTGRSLLSAYQTTMVRIYCVDCHQPHGSNHPFMLRDSNPDAWPSPNSSYPLCFRCHSAGYLLDLAAPSRSSFAQLHASHVLNRSVACSVCHDPHGVPTSRGGTAANGSHLINFDKRYAGPAPVYDAFARTCTVACHSTNPRSY